MATNTKLSSFNREYMTYKAQNLYCVALYGKFVDLWFKDLNENTYTSEVLLDEYYYEKLYFVENIFS